MCLVFCLGLGFSRLHALVLLAYERDFYIVIKTRVLAVEWHIFFEQNRTNTRTIKFVGPNQSRIHLARTTQKYTKFENYIQGYSFRILLPSFAISLPLGRPFFNEENIRTFLNSAFLVCENQACCKLSNENCCL